MPTTAASCSAPVACRAVGGKTLGACTDCAGAAGARMVTKSSSAAAAVAAAGGLGCGSWGSWGSWGAAVVARGRTLRRVGGKSAVLIPSHLKSPISPTAAHVVSTEIATIRREIDQPPSAMTCTGADRADSPSVRRGALLLQLLQHNLHRVAALLLHQLRPDKNSLQCRDRKKKYK